MFNTVKFDKKLRYLFLVVLFFALFFMYYIDIFFVSPKTILILAMVAFCFVFVNRRIPNDFVSLMLIAAGIYVFLIKIYLSSSIFDAAYYVLLYLGTPYFLIYLLTSFIENEEDHRAIIYILIGITLINVIILIGQAFNIDFFWLLRTLISPLPYDMKRAVGLTNYAIDLSYQVVLFVPLCFYLLTKKPSIFLTPIPFFMVIGAILSLTRTSVFSVVMLFLVFIFTKYNKLNKIILGSVLALGAITLIIVISNFGIENFSRLFTVADSSATGRIDLFEQSILTIREYPLGITSREYFIMWDTDLTPHNQYLNMATFHGIPGLLILVFFTIVLFGLLIREIYLNYKQGNRYFEAINFVFMLSLLGFTFHTLFHNAGFFSGNSEVYVIIGLFIAAKNIRTKNDETKDLNSDVSL